MRYTPQYTYSCLKNTNYLFSSTNIDGSNQNLAFGLQTLQVYFEPK